MTPRRFGHHIVARWTRVFSLGLAVAGTVEAQPVVIHDSGQTQSIARYLLRLEARTAAATRHATVHRSSVQGISAERLLPIRTPEMQPGAFKPRSVPTRLHRPLFLIGADPLSRHWLAQSRDRLVAMGAVGILIEAETGAELQAIAALARGLPIMPASASSFAKALGLHTYPVVITADGLMQ